MKFINNYINRFKRSLFLGGTLSSDRNWKELINDIQNLDKEKNESTEGSTGTNDKYISIDNMLKNGLITDEKLSKTKQMFRTMSFLALISSVFIIFYLIFCIIKCYYMSLLMGFLLLLVTLSLSFKYHFWYMQIVQKRLGCTFNDWIIFVFKTKSKHYKD